MTAPSRRYSFLPQALACGALSALALLPLGTLAQSADSGQGLRVEQASWSRWQGRVGVVSDASPLGSRDNRLLPSSAPLQSLTALSDYYFTQQGTAAGSRYSGGFRASGGVLAGARSGWSVTPNTLSALSGGFYTERRSLPLWSAPLTPDTSDANGVVPYLGVGYTGLRSLTGTGGGWGFSADVGVIALSPRAAVRLGQQGMAEALHDMQWSPMLQLGVSYLF